MKSHCYNKATIDIAHNPIQHYRTKHVEMELEAELISVRFVKSKDQLVNVHTKAVSSKVYHNSLDKLGASDICASIEGE